MLTGSESLKMKMHGQCPRSHGSIFKYGHPCLKPLSEDLIVDQKEDDSLEKMLYVAWKTFLINCNKIPSGSGVRQKMTLLHWRSEKEVQSQEVGFSLKIEKGDDTLWKETMLTSYLFRKGFDHSPPLNNVEILTRFFSGIWSLVGSLTPPSGSHCQRSIRTFSKQKRTKWPCLRKRMLSFNSSLKYGHSFRSHHPLKISL